MKNLKANIIEILIRRIVELIELEESTVFLNIYIDFYNKLQRY